MSHDAFSGKRRSWIALAGFVALCFAVAAIGGSVTAASVPTWYAALSKPPFNPPDWVFGPVWTVLYVMIAVAGWRVWCRRGRPGALLALGAWALQLALNLGWSLLFFGAHMIGAALAEIGLLLLAIVITATLFWRIDRVAGGLLVPYAAWVAFAGVLNAAIWRLNSPG